MPFKPRTVAAEPTPPTAPVAGPAARLRRSLREETLETVDLVLLAQAYLADQAVHLSGTDYWRWDRDGIPTWLVARFQDLDLLP